MIHPIHSVCSFQIVGPFVLKVQFDDGITRTIDLSPVLYGDIYGPLRDPALFDAVRIDTDAHTLVWPNGADFDPATLYDWPEIGDKLSAMARSWSMVSSKSRD
jgi:hypothetical protein